MDGTKSGLSGSVLLSPEMKWAEQSLESEIEKITFKSSLIINGLDV